MVISISISLYYFNWALASFLDLCSFSILVFMVEITTSRVAISPHLVCFPRFTWETWYFREACCSPSAPCTGVATLAITSLESLLERWWRVLVFLGLLGESKIASCRVMLGRTIFFFFWKLKFNYCGMLESSCSPWVVTWVVTIWLLATSLVILHPLFVHTVPRVWGVVPNLEMWAPFISSCSSFSSTSIVSTLYAYVWVNTPLDP